MDATEALRRCGGRGTWRQLQILGAKRTSLRRSLDSETIKRTRRGRYRLAHLDTALDLAHEAAGVLSHRSAAEHHGLAVATSPEKPEVIVPRNRTLKPHHRARVMARWRTVEPTDVSGGVTTPSRTVLDCARDLPFTEALAVADSALRTEMMDLTMLRDQSRQLRGPGSGRARLVAEHASPMAANPFESTVRAIALDAGLDVRPQYQVAEHGVWAIVDLADEDRKLVIEAESFSHHGDRRGFRKDIRRYTELVVFGWRVLRVTWEDATLQPRCVRWAFESWRLHHDHGVLPSPPPEHLARIA